MADTLKSHVFVGIKRPYTLRKLGMAGASMAAYTKVRIQGERGTTIGSPTFIFTNAFEANPSDSQARFNILIGYKTTGLPMAVGSVKSYRMKKVESLSFDFSGQKKELFQKVFRLMHEHKDLLTGEVRVMAKSSTLYTIAATVHLIKK